MYCVKPRPVLGLFSWCLSCVLWFCVCLHFSPCTCVCSTLLTVKPRPVSSLFSLCSHVFGFVFVYLCLIVSLLTPCPCVCSALLIVCPVLTVFTCPTLSVVFMFWYSCFSMRSRHGIFIVLSFSFPRVPGVSSDHCMFIVFSPCIHCYLLCYFRVFV